MICEECGKQIPDGSIFCEYCGSVCNTELLAQDYEFCEFCGSRIKVGSKFCENCGSEVVFKQIPLPTIQEAEEPKRLEEERLKAEEAKRLAKEEAIKAKEETKKAKEEAKQAEEKRRLEEKLKAEEVKRLAKEEAIKAKEETKKAKEEAKKAKAEAKQAEEKKRLEEKQRKIDEAAKLKEQRRLAKEEANQEKEEAWRTKEEAKRAKQEARESKRSGQSSRIIIVFTLIVVAFILGIFVINKFGLLAGSNRFGEERKPDADVVESQDDEEEDFESKINSPSFEESQTKQPSEKEFEGQSKTPSKETTGYKTDTIQNKPAKDDNGKCGPNIEYIFEAGTGTLTLSGNGKMNDYSTWGTVPWFEYRSQVKSIVVSEGITSLSNQAFNGCNKSELISLPDSLQEIGWNAFRSCSSVKTITIPKNVKNIYGSGQTFADCDSMSEIKVAEGNKYFKSVDGVLYNYNQTILMSYPAQKTGATYAIPNSVDTILGMAFSKSAYLESITIPSSVKKFDGPSLIHDCKKLKTVYFSGNQAQFDAIQQYHGTDPNAPIFPEDVTIVYGPADGTEAIADNIKLKYSRRYGGWEVVGLKNEKVSKVSIPESYDGYDVVAIYKFMGDGYTGLKEVSISKNIKTIDEMAFAYSDTITKLSVASDNPYYKYDGKFLLSTDGTELVTVNKQYTGILEIPEGVLTLHGGMHNLQANQVYIPASVKKIQSNAFENNECTAFFVSEDNPVYKSVDGVIFSKDGKTLYRYPEKKSGSKYYVPEDVTTIQYGGFRGSQFLKDIYIGKNVSSIEDWILAACKNSLTLHMESLEQPKGFSKDWNYNFLTQYKVTVKWGETW